MFRYLVMPFITVLLLTGGTSGEPLAPAARMQHPSADEPVTAVAFSPDGKIVVSKGNRVICLWEGGKLVRQVKEDQWGRALAISPDGRTLASAGLWDFRKMTHRQKLPEGVRCLAFSPDSRMLALGCDDRTLRIWDVKAGKELHQWSIHPDWPHSVAFSPDGQALAVGGFESLRLIQAATGKELENFRGHQEWVHSVVFTLDGQTLISGSGDRTIRWWDVATGKEKRQVYSKKVYAIALSPDGRTLASGGNDQTVRLWETASLKMVKEFQGHQSEVRAVSFGPDGKSVASAGDDHAVLLWNLAGSAGTARSEDLEKLWADLGGNDAAQAHRAIWTMVAMPKESMAFLKKNLRRMEPLDPNLLADLNSNSFTRRQKATEELERLGEHAEGPLRKVLAGKPPLEVKRRVEDLLAKIKKPESSLVWWRFLRSLQVIEQVNDPEGRKLLQYLASGMAESRWTKEAKTVLERVNRRMVTVPPHGEKRP